MNDHHFSWKHRAGLGTLLNISLAATFAICAVFLVIYVRNEAHRQALAEAEVKARLILDRNIAIHSYFTHNLKPAVFELTESLDLGHYFEPSWMSSTYAVREIENYYKLLGENGFYYKECAVNARSPENEADAFERAFIERLNSDPETTYHTAIRKLDDEYYFVVLRRGEVMAESCLRCHTTPEMAPVGLVDNYGPARSFHRQAGDVVSAVSIRVPLSAAYERADLFTRKLSLVLLVVLILLFGLQYVIYRLLIGNPLAKMCKKALKITGSDTYLGEAIALPASRELGDLAMTFNTMSKRVKGHIDHLAEKIEVRTAALKAANAELRQEIAERTLAEAQIKHMASHDSLTGLPNRALFIDRLSTAIAGARRRNNTAVVLFVDLDGFKSVNDAHGHDAGDLLLKGVSQRLSCCIRETDTVGRFGGDEFVVLLVDAGAREEVDLIARSILDSLAAPFHIEENEICISGSIGVSAYPDDGDTPEDLIKRADKAMYMAKRGGKGRCEFIEKAGDPETCRESRPRS